MRNVVADKALRDEVRQAREDFGFAFTTQFTRPEGVVERQVCRVSSLNQVVATCQAFDTELFIESKLPDAVASPPPTTSGDLIAAAEAGAAGAPVPGGDGTAQALAIVVPMGPPPEALVQEAQASGKPVPWAPAFLCLPGQEGYGIEKAQPVTVVPLPEDVPGAVIGEERRFALDWARANGWAAVVPGDPCTPQNIEAALVAGTLPGSGVAGLTGLPVARQAEYRLNLQAGSLLSARTVLTGTVVYNPDDVEYFKVELGSGRQPGEWRTLGETHRGPVVDGTLETLDAPSLPPGDYIVRLVLVRKDGNFLNPPYSVPVRIGPVE